MFVVLITLAASIEENNFDDLKFAVKSFLVITLNFFKSF